ncbi:hypothetical protein CH75_24350 [Dyella jiangningensis]|uniref:hypothetical protein n=1 Tax=Dyella jiangningensis TaxID=1379159 RepID=UPI00045658B3|nr:hypothetical protein [Dyella jiangningensis]AHX12060.1 hypothetical protein CH75_01270 [Dyella jiangningensis]AHX16006.1 hypothetical protein CH75_24350 [Dyella jiangningensis]MDG2539408.1 hypothetical protein [Dyella jiangningensis]
MNEFEWLRQTRALREPVSPRRDLWHAIDAALDGAASTTPAPRRSTAQRVQGWLLAASFAGLSLFAGSLAVHLRDRPLATAATSAAPDLERWRPSDPRLAGAAVEFDAANMELRQAMEQAPHSPALQRLLYRMQKQQSQLRQLEHQAG